MPTVAGDVEASQSAGGFFQAVYKEALNLPAGACCYSNIFLQSQQGLMDHCPVGPGMFRQYDQDTFQRMLSSDRSREKWAIRNRRPFRTCPHDPSCPIRHARTGGSFRASGFGSRAARRRDRASQRGRLGEERDAIRPQRGLRRTATAAGVRRPDPARFRRGIECGGRARRGAAPEASAPRRHRRPTGSARRKCAGPN